MKGSPVSVFLFELDLIWKIVLAFYFNSWVKYSHVNSKGYCEFAIADMGVFGNYLRIYYKTKGFKE